MKDLNESRVEVIDGLRTFAVLGVLWMHNWSFWFSQPKFILFGINIHRILGTGNTGVNLFFVISGFCMYLMYGKKADSSFSSFRSFIRNRYIRIAPACIVSVLVTGIWFFYAYGSTEWIYYLPFYATFTNPLFGFGGLYPHYWSLCTEWQFYLILPLFFIGQKKYGFARTVTAFIAACLFFKVIIFSLRLPGFVEYTRHPWGDIIKSSIFYRFIEFAYGIIVCHLYINRISIPSFCATYESH